MGGKCPTASAIQTEPHCAAALSLRPSYGRGFFLVRSLWCLGRAFSSACLCNRSQQPGDTMWEQGLRMGGPCALLTPLSGSGDNKSIDCPSPVGAKCKQIEKDREQNRLVSETDRLNGGTAANEMPLWPFPFQTSLWCVPLSATWHVITSVTYIQFLTIKKTHQVQRVLQYSLNLTCSSLTLVLSKWTSAAQWDVFNVAGRLICHRTSSQRPMPMNAVRYTVKDVVAQGHKHRTSVHVRAACHKLN